MTPPELVILWGRETFLFIVISQQFGIISFCSSQTILLKKNTTTNLPPALRGNILRQFWLSVPFFFKRELSFWIWHISLFIKMQYQNYKCHVSYHEFQILKPWNVIHTQHDRSQNWLRFLAGRVGRYFPHN